MSRSIFIIAVTITIIASVITGVKEFFEENKQRQETKKQETNRVSDSKYPVKSFWLEVIMYLIKTWYILVLVLIIIGLRDISPYWASWRLPLPIIFSWLYRAYFVTKRKREKTSALTSDPQALDASKSEER